MVYVKIYVSFSSAVEIQMSHSKGKLIPNLMIQLNLLLENMSPVKLLW